MAIYSHSHFEAFIWQLHGLETFANRKFLLKTQTHTTVWHESLSYISSPVYFQYALLEAAK